MLGIKAAAFYVIVHTEVLWVADEQLPAIAEMPVRMILAYRHADLNFPAT